MKSAVLILLMSVCSCLAPSLTISDLAFIGQVASTTAPLPDIATPTISQPGGSGTDLIISDLEWSYASKGSVEVSNDNITYSEILSATPPSSDPVDIGTPFDLGYVGYYFRVCYTGDGVNRSTNTICSAGIVFN